ncbi:hypothetical protein C7T35_38070 [Variovorax sp. WS11]|uniref:hypothetical protein n=1 Tax=Variovorax sp. WS11 TaxID=1105204 RepID=UPI000D0CF3EE|nr:hypothetical protein [Variovorax sp. WS11]NDZ19005.1 hypothetical protein [Variovorax sp. WS11]PSL79333.1 hypothetical protein C7T35_38070 [Variovorax sp. WS11]
MFTTEIHLPERALLAGTRGALGAGVGLLLSDGLSAERRKNIGWTLVAVGVLTTIQLAATLLFGRRRRSDA